MARRDALLRLHKSLLTRRTELRKRLGMELEDLADNPGKSGDSADVAFDSSGEELASQLAELESKELSQIERALLKLKQGTYGLCESCNCKIPVLRLNALPYSTLCIKCQRELEANNPWWDRGTMNWEQIRDHDHAEDREVKLSDLEMDLSK